MANCVLRSAGNIDTLTNNDLLREVHNATAIVIHSDGGFAEGVGAAAYVVTLVRASEYGFRRTFVGTRGVYLGNTVSAFGAEVAALDLATAFANEFLTQLARR